MPISQSGFNLVNLLLQLPIFGCLGGEQLTGENRYRLVSRDAFDQHLDLPDTACCNETKLSCIPPDCVGQLGAVTDQPLAYPNQHQVCLLFFGLYRHKPHRRPAHRLAQGVCISRIILTALYVRLDQLRGN